MEIIFGLALDDSGWPEAEAPSGGQILAGPRKFLSLLETFLGLRQPDRDIEILRIEQYRQALRHHLISEPEAFYTASFEADAFATSVDLLARRDELLLAGWDFKAGSAMPARLSTLKAVESLFRSPEAGKFYFGTADRLKAVFGALDKPLPLNSIKVLEPLDLIPRAWRNLLQSLAQKGIKLETLPEPEPLESSDLGLFQRSFVDSRASTNKSAFSGDGSLLLLKGKRDADLASLVAGMLRHNPGFRPLCLLPDGDGALNQACMQQGLPGMGLPSSSLARPSLQVLKLVTTFLWEPLDPFKVMQFVSLGEKPLDDGLSYRLSRALAESPGINSAAWYRAVQGYLAVLREEGRNTHENANAIQKEYRFWFERKRYDMLGTAPRAAIVPLFRHLERWAIDSYDDEENRHNSLLVLAEQSRRIAELLETLPETHLSPLELERIVRTVYEPSPVSIFPEEKGHLPYITHLNALASPAEDLIWWNFVHHDPGPVFSRWYADERAWLEDKGIRLEKPVDEHDRLLYTYRHLVLRARGKLLLVAPEYVEGEPTNNHPLLGDLQARFHGFEKICIDPSTSSGLGMLKTFFTVPDRKELEHRPLGRPEPFLQLAPGRVLDVRDAETFSSLDDLFYYPYKWVFNHQLKLRSSPILKIVDDHTLLGNLSHRLIERMLREPFQTWSHREMSDWLEEDAQRLFREEGSVLLMYGREPERVQFVQRMQKAAWELANILRTNNWKVLESEMKLEGVFGDTPLFARADLVLVRGDEKAVVDLKWGGLSYRRDSIKNQEDIQLTLYAFLLEPDGKIPYTAYFILEPARLLARNREAFREAEIPQPESDHRDIHIDMLKIMRNTYNWRREQLREGMIELRCNQTLHELDDHYGAEQLDVLEMKDTDARWDDYRTLIYLLD